jgi:hypothetical protein
MKKFIVFIDTSAEDDLFDIYSYVALNDSIMLYLWAELVRRSFGGAAIR